MLNNKGEEDRPFKSQHYRHGIADNEVAPAEIALGSAEMLQRQNGRARLEYALGLVNGPRLGHDPTPTSSPDSGWDVGESRLSFRRRLVATFRCIYCAPTRMHIGRLNVHSWR